VQNTGKIIGKFQPAEIYLFLLLVIAPIYYHPNLGGSGFGIPDNIVVWAIATLFTAHSMIKLMAQPKFIVPQRFIYLAAFPVLVTLSGFVTGVEQPLDWLFRLAFIWGGFAFLFVLFQQRLKQGHVDRILFVVLWSGLLLGFVGVLQIIFKDHLPFWLPKAPRGVPSAYFQQINVQASYQVTMIAIALYLSSRPFIQRGSLIRLAVLLLSVAVAAYLIGVSGSRLGLLALLLVLLLAGIALKPLLKQKNKTVIALLLVLISMFSLGLVTSKNMYIDKVTAMQAGYSGAARLGIYSISVDLIKDRPLFGYGIGSFPRVWQYAKPTFFAEHPDAKLPTQFVSHPHNELMFWLVEGGVTAVLGLLAVVVGVLMSLTKLPKQRALLSAAMLLPIALHTQVELPLYVSALPWFVFLVILFVLFRPQSQQRVLQLSAIARSSVKITSLLLTTLLMVFYAHTVRSNLDFIFYAKGEQTSAPMPFAYKNPLLYEQAEWIDMNNILYASIQRNAPANVKVFVKWANKKIVMRPDVDLYKKLLDAYRFLGDKTHYCAVAKTGSKLYPHNGRIKNAVDFCGY
jgi:O-antigen polymerase